MTVTTTVATSLRTDDGGRLAQILIDSFPANERDSPDQVIANIEQGRRRCMLAHDREVLVGFAVLLDLPAVDVVLLEYMAVAAEVRDRGIGGRLMDAVLAELAREHPSRAGLLLEVESPDGRPDDDRPQRERRIAFYERHGARVLTAAPAYRVPSTTGPEALPFLLMWCPVALSGDLSADQLHDIVRAVLVAGHDLRPGDAFIEAVLADLRT